MTYTCCTMFLLSMLCAHVTHTHTHLEWQDWLKMDTPVIIVTARVTQGLALMTINSAGRLSADTESACCSAARSQPESATRQPRPVPVHVSTSALMGVFGCTGPAVTLSVVGGGCTLSTVSLPLYGQLAVNCDNPGVSVRYAQPRYVNEYTGGASFRTEVGRMSGSGCYSLFEPLY